MIKNYSDIPTRKANFVRPCFCCKMTYKQFYILSNSTLFIFSCALLIFSLFLLFEIELIFISLIVLLVSSVHLLITLVSFMKFVKYKTYGTVFHKWQAIGNVLFSTCLVLFFLGCIVFLMYLTLIVDLKDKGLEDSLIKKYLMLLTSIPLIIFYIYWSLLFMRIVTEKRILYKEQTAEKQSSEETDEKEFGYEENANTSF